MQFWLFSVVNINIAMNKQVKPLTYNPQFDGLRFCAVLFVVSYHWIPEISEMQRSFFLGGLVNFFFVLSGYLITRILFSVLTITVAMITWNFIEKPFTKLKSFISSSGQYASKQYSRGQETQNREIIPKKKHLCGK